MKNRFDRICIFVLVVIYVETKANTKISFSILHDALDATTVPPQQIYNSERTVAAVTHQADTENGPVNLRADSESGWCTNQDGFSQALTGPYSGASISGTSV